MLNDGGKPFIPFDGKQYKKIKAYITDLNKQSFDKETIAIHPEITATQKESVPDNTPPVIFITTPDLSISGKTVVEDKDILIRGKAEDESGIESKHTLLIADACFSGGIFKTRAAFSGASRAINRLHELPSRKAMTSGTLKEVPDESIFLYYLTKNLKENQEEFLPAEKLFFSFKPAVLNNSENIPQFGVIKNAGDEGGDFIFIKK